MEKKSFNVRLPHEIWHYIRIAAIEREISMNKLIEECLIKYKNNREKRLQSSDTMV